MGILFIHAADFPANEELIGELTLQTVVVVGWKSVLDDIELVRKGIAIIWILCSHLMLIIEIKLNLRM